MAVSTIAGRQEEGAEPGHRADREELRQGLDHADGREREGPRRGDSDRRDQPRCRDRRRRNSARPRHRDLRTGVERQDDALSPRRRERAEGRRRRRVHRRGARARHRVRAQARRRRRERCSISQPDTGEQALEICEILVRSGAVDVVVIDSVAALVPKAEIEGDMGDSHIGLQARLMSQALRKLTGAIARSKTIGDLHQPAAREDRRHVRQPRDDDGRQGAQVLRVGAPRHPPHRPGEGEGGRRRLARPREGREEQGRAAVQAGRVRHHVRRRDQPRVAWCSTSRPKSGIIDKSGAWYSYNGQKIGQGRENAKMYLKDNPALMAEVEEKVKVVLGINADQAGTPPRPRTPNSD